ncbi:G2/mitotic-specific cyclin-B-like [Drosophila kikkawai]|uniref:G2/mitotic-specific cyclin-B-like n=1 Tax=Drosophila kikkawai TaxID=30033 RepID=A0A6P4IIN2_DROKI|nr:G2/mitotic-specific cyclin-B-like [Drosophila kikkawai]
MMATSMNEENSWENLNQVQLKKFTAPSQEAALGDLQNRDITVKDVPKPVMGVAGIRPKPVAAAVVQKEPEVKKDSEVLAFFISTNAPAATTTKPWEGMEEEQPIFRDHLAGQKEVSHEMRAVLIDCINDVHQNFNLAAKIFQLAVAIIDRYLQVVKRTQLELVGITALFMATKYKESIPPAIECFAFIINDKNITDTVRQICQMELQILKVIGCNLSRPLPFRFLRSYSKAAVAEDEHHAMAKYFIELASMDYDLASYRPSEIAAASLFLLMQLINGNNQAAKGFNDGHWTPSLAFYFNFLIPLAHSLPFSKKKKSRIHLSLGHFINWPNGEPKTLRRLGYFIGSSLVFLAVCGFYGRRGDQIETLSRWPPPPPSPYPYPW